MREASLEDKQRLFSALGFAYTNELSPEQKQSLALFLAYKKKYENSDPEKDMNHSDEIIPEWQENKYFLQRVNAYYQEIDLGVTENIDESARKRVNFLLITKNFHDSNPTVSENSPAFDKLPKDTKSVITSFIYPPRSPSPRVDPLSGPVRTL